MQQRSELEQRLGLLRLHLKGCAIPVSGFRTTILRCHMVAHLQQNRHAFGVCHQRETERLLNLGILCSQGGNRVGPAGLASGGRVSGRRGDFELTHGRLSVTSQPMTGRPASLRNLTRFTHITCKPAAVAAVDTCTRLCA